MVILNAHGMSLKQDIINSFLQMKELRSGTLGLWLKGK